MTGIAVQVTASFQIWGAIFAHPPTASTPAYLTAQKTQEFGTIIWNQN